MELNQLIKRVARDYEASMETARTAKGRAVRGNRFPFQTRIAVKNLLLKAQESGSDLRILTGCLPDGFYNSEFIKQLVPCLEAGSDAKVLVWNTKRGATPDEFKKLCEKYDNIQIRRVDGPDASTAIPHMLLVGGEHFRLEQPHGSFDDEEFTELSPEIPAKIVFNDREKCKELQALFDLGWQYSEVKREASSVTPEV